uniref:EGF-like domain-containing protein n=1 Tax=Steinernema glaseri TaxID=37863 RepID=A0A1I7Y5X8_9BILA
MNSPTVFLVGFVIAAVLFNNVASQNATANFDPNAPCTEADCNGRGFCIGLRASPFCLCKNPYVAPRCEDEACEATRDCNGRGLCLGNKSTVTCMCMAGFSGKNCEIQGNAANNVTAS